MLYAALTFASFHPLDLGLLGWVSYVPLVLFAVQEPKGWRAALFAWIAGGVAYSPLYFWCRHTWIFAPVGLGFYHAIFPMFFVILMRGLRRWPLPVSLPVAGVAIELLQLHLFDGTPYCLSAYTQHRLFNFIQVADLAGAWLVSWIVMFVNGVVAEALRSGGQAVKRWAVAAAFLVILPIFYGILRVSTIALEDGPLILVLQPNVPQDVKEVALDPEDREKKAQEIFKLHVDLTREAIKTGPKPDLVIWPETAVLKVPIWDPLKKAWINNVHNDLAEIRAVPREFGIPLLTGSFVEEPIPDGDAYGIKCRKCGERGKSPEMSGPFPSCPKCGGRMTLRHQPSNSALLLSAEGEIIGRYDKTHLVPFSERMPFSSVLPINEIVSHQLNLNGVSLVEFKPGTDCPAWDVAGIRIGAHVCYEAAYPDISRNFAGKGVRAVVNISNEGWFRESAELDLMMDMQVFRAIENRVHCLRAANTGISAFVEPTGRIQEMVADAQGNRKSVRGQIKARPKLTGSSSLYRTIGDAFAWICAGAAVAGLVVSRLEAGRTSDRGPGVR